MKKREKEMMKNSNILQTLLIIGLCMLVSNQQVFSQMVEEANRGLKGGAVYSMYSIAPAGSANNTNEIINDTNGNVMFNIPLGSLPAGRAGLGYSVYLSYNSKMFDTLTDPVYMTPGGFLQSATLLQSSENGGWRYGYRYKFEQMKRPGAAVAPLDPCINNQADYSKIDIYRFVMTFPDGSSREFEPSKYHIYGVANYSEDRYYPVDVNGLHRKYNAAECELDLVQYNGTMSFHSKDGSGLRLDVVTDGDTDPTNNFWTLRSPDGTRVTQNEPLGEGEIGGQRIYDRNGNVIKIDETFGQVGEFLSMTATDEMNRTLTITKGTNNSPDTITMSGVGGVPLTWTVSWKSIGVKRDYKIDTEEDWDDFDPATVMFAFSLVDEIILPSQIGINQKYEFEYKGNANGDLNSYSEGFGEIKQVKMPSGATTDYEFELDGLGSTVSSWQSVQHNPITSKTLTYQTKYDGVTETVTEKWLYDIGRAGSTITSPDGSVKTATYSDVYEGGDGIVRQTGTETSTTKKEFYYSNINNNNYIYRNLTDLEYTTIEDANGNPSLTAIKDFTFDRNNNLTKIVEYDWVDYSSLTYTTENWGAKLVIPANAEIKRITINEYYNSTAEVQSGQTANGNEFYEVGSPDLLNLIKSTEIQDGNGNPVARTEFIYDNSPTNPTTGNLTETRVWDSTKQAVLGSPDVNGFKLNTAADNFIKSTVAYDTYGNPTLTTDAKGYQTKLTYGDINTPSGTVSDLYPTQTETAYGTAVERTSTATYDFHTGLVTSATDEDNSITSETEFDAIGRPTKVKNAVGTFFEFWTQKEYNVALQRIITRSDLETKGDGKKISINHFDELGRVRLSRIIENFTSEDPYDEADGIKVQSRYMFDNGANPMLSDGVYLLTSNPYRAATSALATGEPSMGWTVNYTDKTGNHSQIETFSGADLPSPIGSNTNSSGVVKTDMDADRTLVTDQAGKKRISRTNALGHLVEVWEVTAQDAETETLSFPTDPTITHGYKTSYEYDTLNNLTKVIQGLVQQNRTFSYSSLSRLTSATNPESGTISYAYDNNGNLTSKTDARSITTAYTYDELNRVKTRIYSGESGYTTPNVTYTYDDKPNAKGKLTKVTNGFSTTEYLEFDLLGRVTKSQQTTDGTAYNPMEFSYNLSGSLVEQKFPSGRVVKNVLDNDGQLSIVQSKKNANAGYFGYAKSFAYTAAGAVESLQLGNGKWESTEFNSRLQPTRIALGTTQNATDLLKLDYTYGLSASTNNGNVNSQTITVPITGATSGFTAIQTYSYDELNRIKEASETIGGTQSWKQSFQYDRFGNRRFDEANTDTLEAGCPTAVCNPTIDPATNKLIGYTFDNAGNTTIDAENKSFTYDAENKQVIARDSSGNTIGEYFYDGDGKRVKKKTNDEETIFLYNLSGQLVAEYSTQISQTPRVSYLTNDHLGSPRITTDRDGNVFSRRDFMPFGEEIDSTHTSQRNTNLNYGEDNIRQKFTTYERDAETGLDFAEARMYANKLGRFTSVDAGVFTPADPQNLNRYLYVQNNALKFKDPTGKNIELTGNQAKDFIDYLEKKSGRKLKYKVKNGVYIITGSKKDKSFTGKVNKEFANLVKKVAGASGTVKFDVSSSIVNGNSSGETVFIDDNGTAFDTATTDSSGNKTIRAGNLNLASINSVDSQDTDFAQALVGHALIEGLKMREKGANYDLGVEGGDSAHKTGLKVESKILRQKELRHQQINNPNPTTNDPISFVYTTVQYDITLKSNGTSTVKKISPPTIQRPKK